MERNIEKRRRRTCGIVLLGCLFSHSNCSLELCLCLFLEFQLTHFQSSKETPVSVLSSYHRRIWKKQLTQTSKFNYIMLMSCSSSFLKRPVYTLSLCLAVCVFFFFCYYSCCVQWMCVCVLCETKLGKKMPSILNYV